MSDLQDSSDHASTPDSEQASDRRSGPPGLAWIPGFRSLTWWKAVIACLYYGLCAVGINLGLMLLSPPIIGLFLGGLLLGGLSIHLLRCWRSSPLNLALVAGMMASLSILGASAASLENPAGQASIASHIPHRSSPQKRTAGPVIIAQATSPTPSPEPNLTPWPAETPSPANDPAASPTSTHMGPPTSPPPAPTPSPAPGPTSAPSPSPSGTCGAPPNPWSYNLCGGKLIPNPPPRFCSYFSCIPSFWKQTRGYVELCADGMFSHSGGSRNSCSSHRGQSRPLYASAPPPPGFAQG